MKKLRKTTLTKMLIYSTQQRLKVTGVALLYPGNPSDHPKVIQCLRCGFVLIKQADRNEFPASVAGGFDWLSRNVSLRCMLRSLPRPTIKDVFFKFQ